LGDRFFFEEALFEEALFEEALFEAVRLVERLALVLRLGEGLVLRFLGFERFFGDTRLFILLL
jgi:hypothetical protein